MNALAGTLGFQQVMPYRLGVLRWMFFFAAFTMLAVAAPYLCHQFGLAGQVVLPMHFAVIFAAMVMGVRGGIVTALASPIISFAISGMPPAGSLLPMTIELATYAAVAGWLVHHRRLSIVASLACSMIAGRLVSLGMIAFGFGLVPSATQYILTVFLVGLPGIVAQLVLIPPAVSRVGAYLSKSDA